MPVVLLLHFVPEATASLACHGPPSTCEQEFEVGASGSAVHAPLGRPALWQGWCAAGVVSLGPGVCQCVCRPGVCRCVCRCEYVRAHVSV